MLAVPGPVHAPTSAGTLHLIADGAGLATCADDILLALGSRSPRPAGRSSSSARQPESVRVRPDADGRAVLDALAWQPAVLDQLVERTGWSLSRVCVVLERLLQQRLVTHDGVWFTQVGD